MVVFFSDRVDGAEVVERAKSSSIMIFASGRRSSCNLSFRLEALLDLKWSLVSSIRSKKISKIVTEHKNFILPLDIWSVDKKSEQVTQLESGTFVGRVSPVWFN